MEILLDHFAELSGKPLMGNGVANHHQDGLPPPATPIFDVRVGVQLWRLRRKVQKVGEQGKDDRERKRRVPNYDMAVIVELIDANRKSTQDEKPIVLENIFLEALPGWIGTMLVWNFHACNRKPTETSRRPYNSRTVRGCTGGMKEAGSLAIANF
jgi:hypothetical protein